MEAAGYNWTAGRNVCDWLSGASLRFSPAISITPPVRGSSPVRPPTLRLHFSSQNSVCLCRIPPRCSCAGGWIVIGRVEEVTEGRPPVPGTGENQRGGVEAEFMSFQNRTVVARITGQCDRFQIQTLNRVWLSLMGSHKQDFVFFKASSDRFPIAVQ